MNRMLESLITSGASLILVPSVSVDGMLPGDHVRFCGKEDVHGHALINLTEYQGGTLWKFSLQKEMRRMP